ncbi:MAG TPA: HD domain-containing protein, partial [Polyangiaceae bacterium]
MLALDALVERVRTYQPAADVAIISKAYHFAELAHGQQKRKSGDPYFIHPASVAGIISDLKLDTASICAGLLHDVVEDTKATLVDIDREFGSEITALVDGVTKLSKINFTSKEDRQAESFRKMVVAMSKDLRVLLVKICDRLDNMRTLEHMSPESQERIARETMEIYAPLTNRLGIHSLKSELEDLSLQYLEPEAYREILGKLASSHKERERYIDGVCRTLKQHLAEMGFAADVHGRAKHITSVFRKMKEQQCDYDRVFDSLAFRICVESVTECYAALGCVHSK